MAGWVTTGKHLQRAVGGDGAAREAAGGLQEVRQALWHALGDGLRRIAGETRVAREVQQHVEAVAALVHRHLHAAAVMHVRHRNSNLQFRRGDTRNTVPGGRAEYLGLSV